MDGAGYNIGSIVPSSPAAVALFVVSERGNIVVIRELQEKLPYGKRRGMLSVPVETLHRPHESLDEAAVRCMHEECGHVFPRWQWIPSPRASQRLFWGIELHIAVVHFGGPEFPLIPQRSAEVAFHGWLSGRTVLSNLYRGGYRLEMPYLLTRAAASLDLDAGVVHRAVNKVPHHDDVGRPGVHVGRPGAQMTCYTSA